MITDLNPRSDPPLDFPARPLAEMTPGDYEALGFLCGLEVHQQLLTESKLFCRCPAGRRVAHVDAEVLRHMRPTLSEMGEYDGCALMEFKTRKEIVYLLERSTVCTYEMDDTPPFPIDEAAVEIAYRIALMFELEPVSELHVMRKQYLDGSIPTGFQRTAMVGIDGVIPFRESELGPGRELRIRQLSLEEDSCREVEDVGHRIVFRTDRLGTPLIETVTEPELLTPADVRAGAGLLAQVARASRQVRRGAGAARQDVNVSVAGGRRIEIKGVDHHRGLPLLVHNEAFRQLELLRIREKLRSAGLKEEMFSLPERGLPWQCSDLVVEANDLLRACEYGPIREAIDRGHTVCAVRLAGFAGVLGHRTQPGITFVHELADRARVIACLTARPFLISSHLVDYGPSRSEWRALRRACKADPQDGLIVLWGPERDAATAAREVLARAREALDGVPAETRQAWPDGTTGFERILPGPERMYPDTDTPPLPIPAATLQRIRLGLPERPWEREDRYVSVGLSRAAARRLAAADHADLFDSLAPRRAETARRLAAALEKRLPPWRRARGEPRALPPAERLRPLVEAVDAGRLALWALEPALEAILENEHENPADVLARLRRPVAAADLEARIAAAVAGRGALDGKPDDAVLRWAMGFVLAAFPRGALNPLALRTRLVQALSLEEAKR